MALFVLSASGAGAQTTLTGRVASVLDGKTFVIRTDNGDLTLAIQFIDVPEPEQPLSRIVREHTERLITGKIVTFVSNGFSPTALIGKAYLDGLDLGQQLVRDGAAWHIPPERSGQEPAEAAVYDGLEALAKTEKRGIWAIRDMMPAWEFRSLKDRSYRDAGFIRAAIRTESSDSRNYKPSGNSTEMWTDVGGDAFAQRNPSGPNYWGFDAENKIRNTSTPSVAQVLANENGPLEVELRVIYFQGEIKPRTTNTAFVLGISAISREGAFAADNDLVITADEVEISPGTGQRFYRRDARSVAELLQYKISRSDLAKIASAKKLTIRVGKYSGTAGTALRETILRLLEAV